MIDIQCINGGGIVLDNIVSNMGLPGYLFPYLICYQMIFLNANNIIRKVQQIKLLPNIIQYLFINVISIYLYSKGIFQWNNIGAYLLGMICSMSIFCLMYNVCRKISYSSIIVFLSGISFEIFLVHYFFLGRYSVYKLSNYRIIGFIYLLLCSITAGFCLKYISKKLYYLLTGNLFDK